MRMAKREGGNLGSRYPIVDVFREAWRGGQVVRQKLLALPPLSLLGDQKRHWAFPHSFIHFTEQHLSSTYLYWVSIMGHMLRDGESKEINSSSIPWRSLGQRVKCSMKERVWGLV